MRIAVWAANLLGWPLIQIVIARFSLGLPLDRFEGNRPFYSLRSWEKSGSVYRNWFAIRRWKSLLPDGGPWFGGFAKKRLARIDREYLRTFILETRRAEFAHWCMLACTPLFFLWNPLWACLVMMAYGIAANLPFIVVQRYNRLVLTRLSVRMNAMGENQQIHLAENEQSCSIP